MNRERFATSDVPKERKKLGESLTHASVELEKLAIAGETQKQVEALDYDQSQAREWISALAKMPILPHSGARLQDGGLNREIEGIAFAWLPIPLNDL